MGSVTFEFNNVSFEPLEIRKDRRYWNVSGGGISKYTINSAVTMKGSNGDPITVSGTRSGTLPINNYDISFSKEGTFSFWISTNDGEYLLTTFGVSIEDFALP